ncbi:hypothetical protein HYN59_09180 [Flavobacterium album]|uniref:DUF4296 domain-containing protein n=1 Tax=Flavobacterium album TaxID=2175091 RepID=A0A2S1QXZ1_9FLAO|nr:hypothetical protein [Flavobacterium album]AWH85280.1 hypothetical protein HYN59_09180 [Flavobacterium album]
MKALLILTFSLMILPVFAQERTAEEQFRRDMENHTVKIYILGGLMDRIRDGEADFQKDYNITYYKFGCLAPPNLSFYSDYNLLVFEFLQKRYGKTWEEKIRTDVMAWDKWKPETTE